MFVDHLFIYMIKDNHDITESKVLTLDTDVYCILLNTHDLSSLGAVGTYDVVHCHPFFFWAKPSAVLHAFV